MKAKVNDTRLWCGETRLHPLIGLELALGACWLREFSGHLRFRNEHFSRVALPLLEHGGWVVLVRPVEGIPTWLDKREHNLAKRHLDIPIWMPSLKTCETKGKGDLNCIFECLVAATEEIIEKLQTLKSLN
jgi:hypothetical protein